MSPPVTRPIAIFFFLCLVHSLLVRANTEIVQFSPPRRCDRSGERWPSPASSTLSLGQSSQYLISPVRGPSTEEGRIATGPPTELWIALEFDPKKDAVQDSDGDREELEARSQSPSRDWQPLSGRIRRLCFERYTLRLSWPASHPTDFSISMYTADMEPLSSPSRSAFSDQGRRGDGRCMPLLARIRAFSTGVPSASDVTHLDIPWWDRLPEALFGWPSVAQRDAGARTGSSFSAGNGIEPPPTPFVLTFERLYLGFVPATSAPLIAALAAVATLAWFGSRWVWRGLQQCAMDVVPPKEKVA